MGIGILSQRGGFDVSEQIVGGKKISVFKEMLHQGSTEIETVASIANPYPEITSATDLGKVNNAFFAEYNKVSTNPSQTLEPHQISIPPSPMIEETTRGGERGRVQFTFGGESAVSVQTISRNTSFSSQISESNSAYQTTLNKAASTDLFNVQKNRKKSVMQRELDFAMDQFKIKIKNGTVDVWWLFDDGGT